MRTIILVSMLLALLPFTRATAKGDDVREVRAAIERANAEFSKAFARGDATALAAMYTSDAVAFPPDSEMIKGNKAIAKFWKQTREGGVKSATLTTLDVGRSGNLAYEVGKVSLTIQLKGKQPATGAAKYVVVWKHEGGRWKLHRDIWNSLPAGH